MADDDEILALVRGVSREQGFVPGAPEGFRRVLRDGVLTMPLEDVDAWVARVGGRIDTDTVAAPPLTTEDDGVTPHVEGPRSLEYYVIPRDVLD